VPQHNFDRPRGRLELVKVESAALAGNLLGDPATRDIAVYLPAGYDDSDADYPLFVGLAGFTGSGLKQLGWQAFGESLPQRLDRLVATGAMGPVVLALPDCFTSLGGNQYIDSVALGNWEEFLLDEVLPALEARYRLRRGPRHRAVFGKSSGGYGALIHGLRHGERWGAVACHSGDIDFDLCYRPELPRALDGLARHEGGIAGFLDHVAATPKLEGGEMCTLMLLAMAATYDPDPTARWGIRLPVDPHTCTLLEERWSRWLDHDPLRLVERETCRESLRVLSLLYLDCGSRDQYFLHYGARAFVRRLREHGIDHVYEEFPDTHSGVDYRMDRSLPLLYAAVDAARG